MMQDVQQVKALLARFGLSPNRGWGKTFLVDGDKAEAIAAAACPEGGPVLEIGPGLGALTEPLLARARPGVRRGDRPGPMPGPPGPLRPGAPVHPASGGFSQG